MPRCEICGKAKSYGHRVSHSNIKTNRTWSPNIQRVRVKVGDTARRIYVCTQCLKTGRVRRATR